MGNKYDVYRDKDCMKKFCEYLRKNVMNIIISKRKEWSYQHTNSKIYENANICCICKGKFKDKYCKDKKL